jgi:hypothetical protein
VRPVSLVSNRPAEPNYRDIAAKAHHLAYQTFTDITALRTGVDNLNRGRLADPIAGPRIDA